MLIIGFANYWNADCPGAPQYGTGMGGKTPTLSTSACAKQPWQEAGNKPAAWGSCPLIWCGGEQEGTVGKSVLNYQQKGGKVLLSVGGANADATDMDPEKGLALADTLWHMYLGGGENPEWRPFGPQVVLDGVDLDLEQTPSGCPGPSCISVVNGWANVVTRLRQLMDQDTRKEYYITAVPINTKYADPTLSYGPNYGAYTHGWIPGISHCEDVWNPLSQKAATALDNILSQSVFGQAHLLDFIWPQFYPVPQDITLNGATSCWVQDFLAHVHICAAAGTDETRRCRVGVGLPYSRNAASGGFIEVPDAMAKIRDALKENPILEEYFGGMFGWDLYWDKRDNGGQYSQDLAMAMRTNAWKPDGSTAVTTTTTAAPTQPPTTIPGQTTLAPTDPPVTNPPSSNCIISALQSVNGASILQSEVAQGVWEPSTVYLWEDMIAAVEVMIETGVAGETLFAGVDDSQQSCQYGLVNIAAFLAQAMKETIKYNVCDENNWDSTTGYAASNACGQLGQSYQDYHCPAGQEHMECEVDPSMTIRASTSATWYGAPAPLFCAPKSIMPEAPKWNIGGWCDRSVSRNYEMTATEFISYALDTDDTCRDYPLQKAGFWDFSVPGGAPNHRATAFGREARTDVEGCCWWGRGVIQTTGVCNIGKLNYFLGKKAAELNGGISLYPDVDFCREPDAICTSEDHPELKWIAGFFYWVNDVQQYNRDGWDYISALTEYVDAGLPNPGSDSGFINAVSNIVNRGCHSPPCQAGALDGGSDRAANFASVLQALGL
jgi:chitinase